MVLKTRIIPVILWDGDQAVTTIGYHEIRRVGSMMQHVRNYNERNVDEVIILDIKASREGREPDFESLEEFTSELFCPVTYGGGISKLEHIDKALRAGADKVALGSYLGDFHLRTNAVKKFGSQCIVGSVHYRGNIEIDEYCKMLEGDGIGEILFNCCNNNGSMIGYNSGMIKWVSGMIKIPLIANGGCGSPEHMYDAIINGAHAVAASSMFIFTEHTPRSCAEYLHSRGISVRLEQEFIE